MGSPSPAQDAKLWIRVGLGPHVLGGGGVAGVALLKAKSGQKLDEKSAAGKDKAKVTQQGRKPVPVEITWEGHADGWEAAEAILEAIDPNSVGRGGPFTIDHPDTRRRGVKTVMVEEVGEVLWAAGGHVFRVQITCKEWEQPAKASQGGKAKTPEKAEDWTVHWQDRRIPFDQAGVGFNRTGGTIPTPPGFNTASGSAATTAYTGPDAPSAEP